MKLSSRLRTVLWAAPVLLVVSACNPDKHTVQPQTGPKTGIPRAKEKPRVSNDMQQLGRMIETYKVETGHYPKSLDEWKDYLKGEGSSIYSSLADGSIVLVWNLSEDMPQGKASYAVAWEKEAAGAGNRYVLLADTTVRLMSEEEFNKTPKAKSK